MKFYLINFSVYCQRVLRKTCYVYFRTLVAIVNKRLSSLFASFFRRYIHSCLYIRHSCIHSCLHTHCPPSQPAILLRHCEETLIDIFASHATCFCSGSLLCPHCDATQQCYELTTHERM